jgi:hypothetical protein
MTVEPTEAPAAVAATDTAETPPPAAEPKKPARKKVAQKQQPQNFFDFFTGGRSWDNRSYNNNRSARASDSRSNGFRPFF